MTKKISKTYKDILYDKVKGSQSFFESHIITVERRIEERERQRCGGLIDELVAEIMNLLPESEVEYKADETADPGAEIFEDNVVFLVINKLSSIAQRIRNPCRIFRKKK